MKEQLALNLEREWTIAERDAAEKAGGEMLPVYVKRERECVVTHEPAGSLACFYCGFGKGQGHDWACYTWWASELNEQQFHGAAYIDVPAGGVRPLSRSSSPSAGVQFNERNNQPKRRTAMFEKAARLKLRFDTGVGLVTAEDLWDLPLTSIRQVNLDDLARVLHRQIKDAETESFVTKTSSAGEKLQLRFDIVKRVIDVKLAEREEAATRAANQEKKQRLLELIAKKKDGQLADMPVEELEAMAAAL
jgi:hypothetical protein